MTQSLRFRLGWLTAIAAAIALSASAVLLLIAVRLWLALIRHMPRD